MDPAAAAAAVQNVRLVRYCQLSVTVIVIYDHLLTLSSEKEYIWKKRWTSSKILFLCNRYIGHLIILTLAAVYLNPKPTPKVIFCQGGVILLQWLTSSIVWSTQVILMYRIHAMYSGTRTITTMLAVCFVIEVALMVWLVLANQLIFHGVALRVPAGHDICAIAHVLSYKFAYWIPVMAFEFLLFCLASRIFYLDLIANRQMQTNGRVSLLTLLLRDNMIYFFVSLFTYTATLVVWLTFPPTSWQIPAFYSYNGTTILGCRLILNLCEGYHQSPPTPKWTSPWQTHPWGVRELTTADAIENSTQDRSDRSDRSENPT